MRIIGGRYRSRLISMPRGAEIRPTQDKVREAVFNILGDISGLRILELFAGSGAFGIEAISRGAYHVTFVENNFRCVKAITENLKSLDIDAGNYSIMKADALRALPKLAGSGEEYDIVFMDPPYYGDLARKCLIMADSYDILSRIGVIILEHFKKDLMPSGLKSILPALRRSYGDTVITIFRRANDEGQDSDISGNV